MTAIAHKDIGDLWVAQATFTNAAGTPTDPTNITVKHQDPAGTETVDANNVLVSGLTGASTPVARSGTGVFLFNPGISLNASGHWYCQFTGTGAVAASEDFEVIVDPSPFTSESGVSVRALVTLGETKDWLAERQVDTSDDLKIVQAINAASERVMQVAGREFKPNATNPSAKTFALYGWSKVDVGDLMTASSASTTASIIDFETSTTIRSLASTDYDAMPYNRRPWEPVTTLRFRQLTASALGPGTLLSITGYWGFPLVPEDVKHATMDAVAFWLDRDVEHFRQDLGAGIGEAGQTVFVGGPAPTVFPLPPESWRIANSYTRKLIC